VNENFKMNQYLRSANLFVLRNRCNLRIAFSDQPVAEGLGDCFGLGMHLKLLVDILQVKVDGGGCYA